ncbi:TetR/AcrR family transcriptional regulator [Falsiroseomonas bella]|uniref:TetR/AcrR family transcriptional regulator n=1 Tax=Falsiroseomonas bella TaxID=2184016 RepID=A0A317FCG7_9PROT|nr:TetR/AcrR family transcriptional regulator [Falsiroseomonas bella]PWS35707.1 TetR/AcrR family transcriptional regulator [Falsiroseomonas bella]
MADTLEGRAEQAPGAAPRRRLTPAERLPQLLDAALEEFAERGYGGASMAGVAARAGVAKALLYHYVPGKAELFKAVVRSCIQPVFSEAERLLAGFDGSRAELLRRLFALGYARLAADRREGVLFRLLVAEGERFPELAAFYHAEVLSRGLALVEQVVRSGAAAGEFRPDLAGHPGLAPVLMAPVAMAGVWRLMLGEGQAPSPEAMREAHLALVLRGLGAAKA